jgi:hypothetical protein
MYVRTLYRVVQSSIIRFITLSMVNSTPHHIEINHTSLYYTILILLQLINTHHTTLHYTTSYHTTPHHTTPHHTTPHHTTQHRRTTLHHTAPHYTTPHHSTPHYTTLHQSSPNLRLCQCRSIIRYKRVFNIKSEQRRLQRNQIQVLIVHFRDARY